MCNETGNPAYDGYGVINRGLWSHKGFGKLSPEGKLLFLYLIAGPETKPSGLFEVSGSSLWSVVPGYDLGDLHPLVEHTCRADSPEILTVWVRGMYDGIKDGATLLAALTQVRNMPESITRDRFMAHHEISESTGVRSTMLEAVSTVTRVDALQFSADDIRKVNVLEQLNYTPGDILRLYSEPDGVWYTADWRGMKSPPQRPTLKNIEETIGSLSTIEDTPPAIDKAVLIADVESLLRHGSTRKQAQEHITAKYNSGLWKSMMAQGSWLLWRSTEGDVKFKVYEAIKNYER